MIYPTVLSITRAMMVVAAMLGMLAAVQAQVPQPRVYSEPSRDHARLDDSAIVLGPLPTLRTFLAPYAGKYEARTGSSYEFANTRLRLDIGASPDLIRFRSGDSAGRGGMLVTLGADFFTWTRLRATSSFKFPVEAVDYYFGVNGSAVWRTALGRTYGARLRVAHISAHLVDGDSSFTDPRQQYMTYSREFVDAMAAFGSGGPGRDDFPGIGFRVYIGALALFHTIPDTLGRVTPYAGLEFSIQPTQDSSYSLRAGYEARLNTELSPVFEEQIRFGIKFAEFTKRGVLIEGVYYHGRSQYGQHFALRDRYFALGFGIDF